MIVIQYNGSSTHRNQIETWLMTARLRSTAPYGYGIHTKNYSGFNLSLSGNTDDDIFVNAGDFLIIINNELTICSAKDMNISQDQFLELIFSSDNYNYQLRLPD